MRGNTSQGLESLIQVRLEGEHWKKYTLVANQQQPKKRGKGSLLSHEQQSSSGSQMFGGMPVYCGWRGGIRDLNFLGQEVVCDI